MLRRNFLSVIPAGLLTLFTGSIPSKKEECYIYKFDSDIKGDEFRKYCTAELESRKYFAISSDEFKKYLSDALEIKQETSVCKRDEYGTKRWYNSKGQLHRDNGLPAVEHFNGAKEWWINGIYNGKWFTCNNRQIAVGCS